MRIPPTEIIVSWPEPNYINPNTQGESLIITNATFMVLIILAVALRFYSRLRTHKWLGLDDIFIGIALVFALGLGAIVILANVRYGWDRHLWDVQISQYVGASSIAFAAKAVFTLAATSTRVSLICFYFRLIRDSGHRKLRWTLRAAMAWQIAVCLTFVLLTIFLCSPVDGYWDLNKAFTTKCMDEGAVTLAAGVINCVSDLMVTLLPIPIIMRLKMPLKQRIGVTALLSVGLLVTIAGIIRTYFIWKALIDTYDETWYSYPLWICAAIEIDLAVLCACAPALKPLVAPLMTSIRTKTHSMRLTSPDDGLPGAATAPKDSHHSSLPSIHKDVSSGTRADSYASSQKALLGAYGGCGRSSRGRVGSRPDAEDDVGRVIELERGYRGEYANGEGGFASTDEGMGDDIYHRGIESEKRFDVRSTPP